ncbi:autotransporter outer membrane beta-barrel domain-containing protein [Luteibacter aegosomatissinici]|uniref:autotransporter outer membrane beta-barrel domain-containing protein n=1 Tax=Luteibacter aegosomatissinici TaxID=2911539 RepID=UPI001FF799EC|nr:autotransporter outer membrane beta-barrel domain-containing protein [Luteibacter aegosomatissinici]UPG96116.1 autotransporter outer membrane beta-barrel domain-containing protein [Luteibacter aegosomatissinici]
MTTCDALLRRPMLGGATRLVLAIAIATALSGPWPVARAQTVAVPPYNPIDNDQQVGRTDVPAGGNVTLNGPQQFQPGQTGGQDTTLQQLSDLGRLLSGQQWIGAARLNPGSQNFGITVKDPITGTNRVVSVYNTNNLFALAPVGYTTVVPDIVNVGDNQYIDARVGQVGPGGGTLTVAIGTGANSQAAENSWSMAAKQTNLFYADGTGGVASNITWAGQNRITFNGEVADPTQPRTYGVSFVAHYGGTFNVTTADGTASHTVTNDAQLRDYNNFLIAQIQAGKLDPAQYVTLFSLGYTSTTEQITYGITADSPPDDVAQPIGDRIVMRMVGANAHGTINAGAVLEVVNANGGAVRADSGASFVNNGTLAAQHSSGDGSALVLTGSSSGANAGVINGNFFRNADGGISSGAFGANIVDVQSGSTFSNAAGGIINLALGTTNGAGKSTGIRVGTGATASNDGFVNVGVTGSRSNGSADGVYLNDATASFTNGSSGVIYIGRGPQYAASDNPADVAINQGTITTGINVPTAATVNNLGTITIGTGTQNAAGILVTAPAANVTNAGTINITGRAAAVPRENIGISVVNAGATGPGIRNTGTINVTGVNGTALKAVSTAGTPSLVHSTGTINVAGGADPASGTRNYGVWIEGQGSATATGDIQGAVNLQGDGAIGIHARGRATVNVAAGAAPSFQSGSKQIGFFAFGDNAKINVAGGTALNVSTPQSTLFRLDSGADFDGTGLAVTVSGAQATGVLGSGAGSVLNTRNAVINVTGAGAQGVVAEGGSTATIDAATTMALTGNGAIAGVADGQKHDLTGAATGAASTATSVNSLATLNSSAAGVIGLIARNRAKLANAGALDFSGANTTGLIVETGATAINSGAVTLGGPEATGAILRSAGSLSNTGSIAVANGTGVRIEGAGTVLNPAGTITVNDGHAGVWLTSGASLALGSGDSAITTRGSAHGILVDAGATSLVANGTTITTLGTGNAIENAAETSAITLTGATLHSGAGAGLRTATAIDPASTATFEVDGPGAGYAFRHADGSVTTGDLAIGAGFTIHGNGAGSTGIQALTTGAVSTAASVNILSPSGGSALVAGTASSVSNSGVLSSVSTVAPVVDLANGTRSSLTNSGSILAASASAVAVRGSAGSDVVSLSGGQVRGEVATGEGGDTFAWTGGTLDGGLTMGSTGNHATLGAVDTATTYHLIAGAGGGNTLDLVGTQARGGTFDSDTLDKGINLQGWNTFNLSQGAAFTLTDKLVLAGSDVTIDASSTLYAGDNVHPVISAATPGGANVTNAGTIDLTNGTGSPGNTLTIDGNYTGQAGLLRLVTTMNAGGALAAQGTDRLLVQGDASGETVLDIAPSLLSTGAITDVNRNGYVGADEGISVVQVAGQSSGGAFRLNGGYLAFGPYQYGLYAFQPGSSEASQRVVAGATSGNAFWDYRLANVIVCNGPCPAPTTESPAPTPAPGQAYIAPPPPTGPLAEADARLAVVPQVPTSIVSPSALSFYGYRAIDNLHRRLGEVRNMDDLGEGLGGETFVRYFGGDYHYSTNRAFRDYGYDYDIDMRAVQVGTNIFALDADRSTLRAGVAYTHGTTQLDPKAADGYSHAKLYTNSIAMFVTWQHVNGFYVDVIASGDRHAGDVDTARIKGAARVRGSGWNGSVEAGYPFWFDGGWELEPQLQLIRQHIGLRDQVDVDQVTTHYEPFEQTVGRAGLRFDRTWITSAGSQFTPYARANYIKGWGGISKVDVGAEGFDFSQQFAGGKFGQMVELGLGGTWAWRNKLSVYGEADWQNNIGEAGARGWSLNLGLRWNF